MSPHAEAILAALEFRKPMMLRNVEPLTEAQMHWRPGPGRNSIAWQLWHIAEVEDSWIRLLVTEEPLHFPFGVQLRDAQDDQYPTKAQLLDYFKAVRDTTRERLARAVPEEFARTVEDADFGPLSVLDVWAGVATSFAWHAGQIALTAKLLPQSPVDVMPFGAWKAD